LKERTNNKRVIFIKFPYVTYKKRWRVKDGNEFASTPLFTIHCLPFIIHDSPLTFHLSQLTIQDASYLSLIN
jgi:hypothetical protein